MGTAVEVVEEVRVEKYLKAADLEELLPGMIKLVVQQMRGLIDPVIDTLAHVRRAKTEAKQSQKAAVESLVVTAPAALHAAVTAGDGDLRDAGSIATVTIVEGGAFSCAITLAPTD